MSAVFLEYRAKTDALYKLVSVPGRGGPVEVEEMVTNAPVVCKACIKDMHTGEYGYVFDVNGVEISDYSDRLLDTGGEGWKMMHRLANGGFKKKQEFVEYLLHCQSEANAGRIPTIPGTSRLGWSDDGSYYLANGFTFGKDAPRLLGARGNKWASKGDRKAYKKLMRELMRGNPVVGFLVGYYAAGSLVRLVGAENFILGIIGRTSVGKSLAIRVALAMRGDPDSFATFDSTANSLKWMLRSSADGCMPIDEIGQSGMKSEDKQKLIYDISQGKERGRLSREGDMFSVKESERAFYTVIVTGEESLSSAQQTGGASVRLTELFFDEKKPLWNTITEAHQAEELEQFLRANHGWLMPEIIEYIAEHRGDVKASYAGFLDLLRSTAADNGRELDNAEQRRLKLLALAVTGAEIVCKVLGCEPEAIAQIEEYASNILFSNELSTPVSKDDEKFHDFLTSLPATYQDRLFGLTENPRSIIGECSVVEGFTDLKILKNNAERLAGSANVDLTRFLKWADENGYLKTINNGDGKRAYVKRMKVAGSKTACYHFIWKDSE